MEPEEIVAELMENIKILLSQYSSALLAWKGWGINAVERTHDLKLQIAKEILQLPNLGVTVEGELPPISWVSNDPLYDIAFAKGLAAERDNMFRAGYNKKVIPIKELIK